MLRIFAILVMSMLALHAEVGGGTGGGVGPSPGGGGGGSSSASTVIATGSTTARTLATRFAERINVKDYGALGDGVADDSTAINAAIAAATGKVVYFPSGTYLLNSINTVIVGVSCRLTSDGGATIKSSGGGIRCIIITASVVQIDHLTMDCNNDLTRNGISIVGDLSDIVIDSCEIKNFVERGIYSSQNTLNRVTISNCYIHDGTKAGIALYAHSPLSKSVNDIQILDNRVATIMPGTGVGIGITISDVNAGANVQTVNRVQICRNRVRDVERVPIETQRGSGLLIQDNVVTGAGGTVAGGTFGNNGISAGGCENTVITGNYISDQTNEGIEVGGAVNLGGLVISNNTVYNCYRGISGGSPGTLNTSIVGNTFTKTGYVAISGATNPDVIRLVGNDASTAYVNLSIVGNSAYDILNGAFAFVARAADINISNNVAEDGANALYGRHIRIQECLRGGVYNNDLRASGTGYASLTSAPLIEILTGSDQLFIEGNRCQGINAGVVQRAGIRSNNVTTSNVWITGNYVTNLAVGIQANGTSPTSYHILDNQVVGCTTPYTVSQGQIVRAEQTLVPCVTAAGTAKTANYTIPITETIVYGDATGGVFNLTLPTTPTTGYTCFLRKIDTGANAITIVGTVDGVSNPTLTADAPNRIISYDGTGWRTLGGQPVNWASPGAAFGSGTPVAGTFTTLTSTGVLSADANTDTAHNIGKWAIGYDGTNAGIANLAANGNLNQTDYALLQVASSGQTVINCKTGQTVGIRVNNSTRATMGVNTWTVVNGVQNVLQDTTDATSASTGSIHDSGGIGALKNIVAGQNMAVGVATQATAAGTTTLTVASLGVQIFTGATTQTVQLPLANVLGAGISVHYTLVNRSSGSVSWQRAGSDTINGAASNVAVATVTVGEIWSDGVSAWYTK